MIHEALQRASLRGEELDAVAVANTPGLAGSLLVGLSAAKTAGPRLGIPLVAVNHLQAHIYACRLAAGEEVFPCVGLIVSGGHSSLYRCRGPLDFELLGGTIDDAAGEAFDKVASLLGLGFPGGPSVQRAAERGNPTAFDLPRAFLRDEDAGLQLQRSEDGGALRDRRTGKARLRQQRAPPQQVADLAASFQEAVVDCLVGKAFLALAKTGLGRSAWAAAWRPTLACGKGSRSRPITAARNCTCGPCGCAPTTR